MRRLSALRFLNRSLSLSKRVLDFFNELRDVIIRSPGSQIRELSIELDESFFELVHEHESDLSSLIFRLCVQIRFGLVHKLRDLVLAPQIELRLFEVLKEQRVIFLGTFLGDRLGVVRWVR